MAISSRNKISVQFSMSGMTDIVFLLLIFFMLSSTLVAPKLLNLLPRSSTSKDNPLVEKIQVQIDFNSAGQLTYSYDKVRAASFEDFRTHVENRRMEKKGGHDRDLCRRSGAHPGYCGCNRCCQSKRLCGRAGNQQKIERKGGQVS